MSKEEIIYRKVLKDVLNMNLENTDLTPEDIKVETLVEKAIAKVGKLKWVGGENEPYDFEDGTDAKTSSVTAKISYSGHITSTESKEGALRCVVTNEASPNEIDFFYIPAKAVRKLEKSNGSKAKKGIKYTYNPEKDTYTQIEEFRVKNFKELSTYGNKG